MAVFLMLTTGAALAQTPEAPAALPRVLYGTPAPSVIYGPSSAPPVAPPAPVRAPQPSATLPAPAPAPRLPSTGYFWLPPTEAPPHWNRPRWRPLPEVSVPAARGGYYERPLPQGSYVGRAPATVVPERPWGREGGRRY